MIHFIHKLIYCAVILTYYKQSLTELLLPRCPENETYSICGNNECQKTCANPNITEMCNPSCNSGCICIEGFMRNSEGNCVSPDLCAKVNFTGNITCPPQEVFSQCGNNECQNTCSNPNNSLSCNPICSPGCICMEGCLRNTRGFCVPPRSCARRRCPPYEKFNICGNNRCQNTCMQPNITKNCNPVCAPGCVCIEGFLRDTKGKCVPPIKCDTCKKGEIFSDCGNDPCQNTCKEPDLNNNCTYEGECYFGCNCQRSLIRDTRGNCVRRSECENYRCGKNESWNWCPKFCTRDANCTSLFSGIQENCGTRPPFYKCTPGCFCKKGYLRINNLCEKSSQCCFDRNAEVVSCPNPCPGGTCAHPKLVPCQAPCKVKGCQCKRGYVKGPNGKCIHITECPKCPENEIYSKCGNNVCQDTCLNPNMSQSCTAMCNQGCICRTGYLRNTTGFCVLRENCDTPSTVSSSTLATAPSTIPTCQVNEVYNPCPSWCTFDQTCFLLLNDIRPLCTIPPPNDTCKPRCECLPGHVRTNGQCEPESTCCSDPNSLLTACPNPCPGGTCLQPTYSPCNLFCKPVGCVCRSGYLLNDTGCVPSVQCAGSSSTTMVPTTSQ